MPPPPPPPPTARPSTSGGIYKVETPKLELAVKKFKPPIITIMAVPGWGKTTTAAFAPKPAILMAEDEQGYLTLLGAGRVPPILATTAKTWSETLAFLDSVIEDDNPPFKTLILDAVGGFERHCHKHVCNRDYGGDWGEDGFGSFQRGYETSVNDWKLMLSRLERIRSKGIMIILLAHTKITQVKNPIGLDFSNWSGDAHKKSWAQIHRISDCVLLGRFNSVARKLAGGQVRSTGGEDRVVHTDGCDAFDAKNRFGMPQKLELSENYEENWNTIWNEIKPTEART